MDIKLLHKFFAVKATDEEILKIRQWVEQSDENREVLIMERKIYDTMQMHNLNEANIDSSLSEIKIHSEKSIDNKPKVRRFRLHTMEVLKIASIVLITFIASWTLLSKLNSNIDLQSTAMQTINVPTGQRVNVVLPDGTNVWINSKSTLRYPVSFNRKERNVYLEGQAFFDVAKNEETPFRVNTKDGSVKALGTAFDVISDPSNKVFETMLMEGSVEVNLFANPDQKLRLEPNMKATAENNHLFFTYVDDETPYEWRNGLISFRDKKFKEIVTILEKTYDIKIVLENPYLGSQVYTGKFRISDGVQYALDILSLYKKIEYRIDYENHTIYITS